MTVTRGLPIAKRKKERVLRHVRWRATVHLLGNQWTAFPHFIWTFVLILLALFALKVDLLEAGSGFTRFLWWVAIVGFGCWIADLAKERPALSWAGYYMSWMALAGVVLSVPTMVYVGYALIMVGLILAALGMPSRVGFAAMAIWGMIVGVAVEHFCLQPVSITGPSSVGMLIYAFLAILLLYCLGFLEGILRSGLSDDLTGVGSRRLLRWLSTFLLQTADRQERPISLLLVDIDNFKAINDSLGHPFGDLVLQRFAAVLENELRPDDIICRYGGDEFVVILQDTTNAEAMLVAERLRRRVTEVFRRELPDESLTISIGISTYPEHSLSMEGLIEQADTAMMAGAKLMGKDKVATAAKQYHPDLWDRLLGQLPSDVLPLLRMVSLTTEETIDHMTRLADLGSRLGEALGLSDNLCATIAQAGALHDVGKIAIPKAILTKPGPLTWEERQTIMMHSELGATMLANLDVKAPVVEAVRHHHEWWDGTGYPDGLRGEQIPIAATILAVVDAYDAMTTSRPYQQMRTPAEALQEIAEKSGTQFDPRIGTKLLQLVEGEALQEVAAETYHL